MRMFILELISHYVSPTLIAIVSVTDQSKGDQFGTEDEVTRLGKEGRKDLSGG